MGWDMFLKNICQVSTEYIALYPRIGMRMKKGGAGEQKERGKKELELVGEVQVQK
jgi:hypothetical protein